MLRLRQPKHRGVALVYTEVAYLSKDKVIGDSRCYGARGVATGIAHSGADLPSAIR
jgi:hypothetical protein